MGDHQCSSVKRRALEDPVKNGVCSRNVRPPQGDYEDEFAV